MQVRAVDFIGIPVADMAIAREFYSDILGLRAIRSFGDGWAEYDVGGVTIALIAVGAAALADRRLLPEAAVGVALAVSDVAATVEELRQKGVTIAWDTAENPPCFMAVIQDPFGNWLWLHQRKDGTAG